MKHIHPVTLSQREASHNSSSPSSCLPCNAACCLASVQPWKRSLPLPSEALISGCHLNLIEVFSCHSFTPYIQDCDYDAVLSLKKINNVDLPVSEFALWSQFQKNFLLPLQSFFTQTCANSYCLLSLLVKKGRGKK